MARGNLQHAATVFIVDSVEPCVAFWVDRFGFQVENQVPGADGNLVFASVKQGDIEVMYQTRASVLADNPAAAAELNGHSATLFITAPDRTRSRLAWFGYAVMWVGLLLTLTRMTIVACLLQTIIILYMRRRWSTLVWGATR